MTDTIEERINKKRTFTITCSTAGGVKITDGTDKEGGNTRTQSKKSLTWKNATNQPNCFLAFRRLLRDDAEGGGELAWPFEEPAPTGYLLVLPKGKDLKRVLAQVAGPECYEYAVLGADGKTLQDPVIIIDPD